MDITFKNCLDMRKAKPSTADDFILKVVGGSASVSIFNCCLLPAFCDVHVHLREPGFFYK